MTANIHRGILMSNDAEAAHLSAAHAALVATDFAKGNIERYLNLHGGASSIYVMKIGEAGDGASFVMKIADRGAAAGYNMKIADHGAAAGYNMKIADETFAGLSKIVNDSAALASKTLQSFMDSIE